MSAADFSIGKRAVTVTATAGQGKTYGNADPSSYDYTCSDLGTGVALVGALDRASGEDVGTYAIGQGTLTNGANSNYDISFVSNDFSIGKRAITVTATAARARPTAMPIRHPTSIAIRILARVSRWLALSIALRARMWAPTPSAKAR